MNNTVTPEMAILSLRVLNIFLLAPMYWISRSNIKSSETINKIQPNYHKIHFNSPLHGQAAPMFRVF